MPEHPALPERELIKAYWLSLEPSQPTIHLLAVVGVGSRGCRRDAVRSRTHSRGNCVAQTDGSERNRAADNREDQGIFCSRSAAVVSPKAFHKCFHFNLPLFSSTLGHPAFEVRHRIDGGPSIFSDPGGNITLPTRPKTDRSFARPNGGFLRDRVNAIFFYHLLTMT